MIEESIAKLIASIERNTAALIALADKPEPKAAPAAKAPPKASKPAPEPAPEAVPTKEEASKAVEALLKANKRAEAIALLGKFKAKAVSGIAESDYAAFVEAANAVLLAA